MAGEHSKYSFVARIWLEPGSNGNTTWRGHLQHVQSKEEKYFQDLMEMREFLGRVSGVTGPALTVQPLKVVTKSESTTKLESSTKLEPSAKSQPSTRSQSGSVTDMKLKDWSETQMPTIGQRTQAEATKAQGDPKSLQPKLKSLQPEVRSPQPEAKWGGKLFFGVLITVMVFFWWLLIYSGGVVGSH